MHLANKELGETPLQCIQRLRRRGIFSGDNSVTYAGRLDPAAEGLMLFLNKEEEIKNKSSFLALDKEYAYEILIGVSTDTFDLLGLIGEVKRKEFNVEEIGNAIASTVGTYNIPYPVFSGKTIGGKKLFEYGKSKEMDIETPIREMRVFSNRFLDARSVSVSEIVERNSRILDTVHGSFRQEDISEDWKNFKKEYEGKDFVLVKSLMHCASGTYVRAIINKISTDMNIPMCAYSIFRSKIGDYDWKSI